MKWESKDWLTWHRRRELLHAKTAADKRQSFRQFLRIAPNLAP